LLLSRCCFLSLAFLQPRFTAIPTPKPATNLLAVTTTAKVVPKLSHPKKKRWKTATNSAKSAQKKRRNLLKKVKSRVGHLATTEAGFFRPFLFVLESENSLEIFDSSSQTFVKRYFRFPAKKCFRKSYIWAADTRIIAGKRHEDEF